MNKTSTTTIYLNYDGIHKVWETIDNPYNREEEKKSKKIQENIRIGEIKGKITDSMNSLLKEIKELNQFFTRNDILDI